jgi:hypothetical protein
MDSEEREASRSRVSRLAVIAAIFGFIAFFFAPAGLVAVISGHVGLFRVSRSSGMMRGKGLCIFALVMGYLAIAFIIYNRTQ